MQGIDYTNRIPATAIKAAGYHDVFRYLGDPNVWPKAMTQAEATDLRSNGITVHLNYEQAADFMLGGYSAGKSFAGEARKWATWLGFPTDATIYYSADFDVSDAQVNEVMAFLQGAENVEGSKSKVGIYGGYKIVSTAINQGYGGWQASAWSGGQYDTRALALQFGTVTVNGVQCDLNAMNPNYNVGGNTMSGTIPQSIRDKWPAIANQFTGTYDDSTAILWADAGARYAAWQTDNIMNKLNGITGAPAGPVNLTAADIEAIASAVAKKLAQDLSAG
jgi:hypothetical protein